jgi:hypothetical protein
VKLLNEFSAHDSRGSLLTFALIMPKMLLFAVRLIKLRHVEELPSGPADEIIERFHLAGGSIGIGSEIRPTKFHWTRLI